MSSDDERIDESMARLDPKRLGDFCAYCGGFVPGIDPVPGAEVRHSVCHDIEMANQRMHAECVDKLEVEMAERQEQARWEYEYDRERAHYEDQLDEERRQRELEAERLEWEWRGY